MSKHTDRWKTEAEREERHRLARDVHDSVIQPYLGLRIGLTTIHQNLTQAVAKDTTNHAESCEELAATVKRMTRRLEQLIELTDLGITDLRDYVKKLKSRQGAKKKLIPSIRHFAAVFAEAIGICLEVSIAANLQINNRLVAEVFQMVVEGLSNIRRHTQSERAWISLTKENSCLVLRIENDCDYEARDEKFIPHSITERAQSLLGNVVVEQVESRTAVIVTLPL